MAEALQPANDGDSINVDATEVIKKLVERNSQCALEVAQLSAVVDELMSQRRDLLAQISRQAVKSA